MVKGIYVKLPTGIWVRIKGKISRTIVSRNKSKRSISYTLLGESIDKPPKTNNDPQAKYYISATRVTKYILRLLDETRTSKYIMIIKPITKEKYEVLIYGNSAEARKAHKIAEEMNILKQPPKKILEKLK
ncbi:hypothetical protein [Staphylothermus hellenicus]|uniref:Uncharacterized protein n=1 Tax=Staphylothermus hellenicus (strain DSM 12710 / JCM 10830 / BK20S6-10-b1 / P8) TaxID=591019 RepID=D7DB35_STAHD|nr:hypothetical protein [Staphylothermus hellenicus]ADI31382.1 hypothetical protein Shell_0243 [Staphylothermus hellenicus DSM 12710]